MAINQLYVQAQTFTLAGSGVSAGDTSATLVSFDQIDGTQLTMANFGTKGYGTNEPGSGMSEEQIVWTGVTVNDDGTTTLTGISSVLDVYPYTESSGFSTAHVGGTAFVISNTAGFYSNFANIENDTTITATWLIEDPTLPTQIANKEYVDDAIISGGVPATTTNPGISMEATQADIEAKNASRDYLSNPYQLFVNPSTLSATLYNDFKTDTGSVNAYAIAPNPAITAYVQGQQFTFSVTVTNTGASTLNVNGLGAKNILKNISHTLTGGELVSGAIITVSYDGTEFQIQSTTAPNVINSSLYTVNADESISSWFTSMIGRMSVTSGIGGWTNAFGTLSVGSDISIFGPSNHGGNISGIITTTFTSGGKGLRLKFYGYLGGIGNANNDFSITFGNAVLKWIGTWSGAPGGGFLTFNGTDVTSALNNSIITTPSIWEFVWDGTNVYLYIAGNMVATAAVGFPSSSQSITIALDENPSGGSGPTLWTMTDLIRSFAQ